MATINPLNKASGRSKQAVMGKSLFGNRFGKSGAGKTPMIGRKFKKVGKGVGSVKPFSTKSSSISPSTEEFDDLLNKSAGKSSKKGKSSFFGKKFG